MLYTIVDEEGNTYYRSISHWIKHKIMLFKYGREFNYPLCCILSFIKDFDNHPLLKERYEVMEKHNLKYVPCKVCAWRIE